MSALLGRMILGRALLGTTTSGTSTVITPPAPPVVTITPYYVRQRQPWAVTEMRQRVVQANYVLGEYVMFTLMWHIQDFKQGLVVRCARCFDTVDPGSKAAMVASVYKQPTINKCPECFGTTFEGGIKAQIVRSAILTDADQAEQIQGRGVVHPSELNVQTSPDFRIRTGDYLFRGNGDRFYLRTPQRGSLRTGFIEPTMIDDVYGYNLARASLEDPSTVAYTLGPSPGNLSAALANVKYVPSDFSALEIINAPLIPAGD